jgi:cardiolipin synthase A/B
MNTTLEQVTKTAGPTCPDWQALCVPDLDCNGSLRLFTEGDDLYDAMIAAIAQAERSICLESFIFAGDDVGRQFAEVLSAKARAGVEVRFHFDSRGAATGYSWPVFREMISAGVKLKWYRPWSWRHPTLYFQRNHRKLLIIDDQELFLGGFNIRVENSRRLYGEERKRDTHVSVRGSLALRAAALFDQLWNDPDKPYADFATEEASLFDPLSLTSFACLGWKRIACFYAGLIENSVRRVYITTPYFCSGSIVARAARQAARRGVEVRLLVPRCSDPPFVGWLTRSGYTLLMDDGVRIHEYVAPRKLHAKTAVIDDEWCIIGSPNLDHLSLLVNHELMLVARDGRLGSALTEQFYRDLTDASEVNANTWAKRDWAERGLEALGWTARKIL